MTHCRSKKSSYVYPLALGLLLLSLNTRLHADAFCFALAENYYEQIYCELQARGKGRDLPAWRDFRNNDETTQALLLKRPAQRAGIALKLPRRRNPAQSAPATSNPSPTPFASEQHPQRDPGLSNCSLQPHYIACGTERFMFVSNRRNGQLRDGALSPENRMNLPQFSARHTDQGAVQAYLQQAFIHYLQRMMDIGLGETTLSFAKFRYIFEDLADRQVDFAQRFETMYTYLKKDKAKLAVRVSKQAPTSVTLDNCLQWTDTLISCSSGGSHALFTRSHLD